MTDKNIARILELHRIFKHPINETPVLNNVGLSILRLRLIEEEWEELSTALKLCLEVDNIQNRCNVLDALSDLQVVLDGAYIALGFYKMKEEALEEVQRSNLSKLGEDGKPIMRADGKFLKGPNYTLPDLYPIVRKYS